ncbi:hypothetical protein HJG60_010512 [Phyllostomus discolor]|uniref:Uncharacterized protein n=1 Tax=Phyllostomus discolor TaxID=89673 RepID=A0A834EB96_9CHIR|nr:hypothetical protein HJG60_010512 [Phyllostomus discolor]
MQDWDCDLEMLKVRNRMSIALSCCDCIIKKMYGKSFKDLGDFALFHTCDTWERSGRSRATGTCTVFRDTTQAASYRWEPGNQLLQHCCETALSLDPVTTTSHLGSKELYQVPAPTTHPFHRVSLLCHRGVASEETSTQDLPVFNMSGPRGKKREAFQ